MKKKNKWYRLVNLNRENGYEIIETSKDFEYIESLKTKYPKSKIEIVSNIDGEFETVK